MSRPWSELTAAIRYGYSPHYFLVFEGIPTVFCEHAGDAIAPTNFDLDASLVIDQTARIGAVIDEETHCSRGFDLNVRLLDSETVREYMQRPSKMTTMSADFAATDTAMSVVSTAGWSFAAGVQIYFGTSCAGISAPEADRFPTVVRSPFGPLRTYKRGTWVTDRPVVWKGRRATLYLSLLDPSGRYVQGTDCLSDACVIWQGHVLARPERDGVLWSIPCRDQVRRLTEPLGVAASGTARWTLDDDYYLMVDSNTTLTCRILVDGVELDHVRVQPFAGRTWMWRSEIRAAIVSALDAAWSSADVGTPHWQRELVPRSDGMRVEYRLMLPITSLVADDLRIRVDITGQTAGILRGGLAVGGVVIGTSSYATALVAPAIVDGAALAIDLDDVDGSELPTSGWVQLEGDTTTERRRYVALQVDPIVSTRVHLTLDPTTAPTGSDLQALARDDLAGTLAERSATFLWSDSGTYADVLRRAIASSGEGTNGTFDVLPRGQGLDLTLDEDSFVSTFDGGFRDLVPELVVNSGTTLEEAVSGILRLSRRALTSRRASDGSGVQIAAISIGSADAGVPVATIADATLVSAQGRAPVRKLHTFKAPQVIACRCKLGAIGPAPAQEASVVFKDDHLAHWTAERWRLDIHGIGRDDLMNGPGFGWATSWFRSGETRQIIEVDVAPWVDAQDGDLVWVDLQDPSLWDFATATPGLLGLARVLGAQVALVSGLQTLTLALDGLLAAGPMCPSLAIAAVNGSATAPTSIDVDESHYDLLVRAKDSESSWSLLAYLPGQDAGRAVYTLGAISLPGGGVCRLAVTSSPSSPTVSLTTSYRLTYPVASACTATQDVHLHISDVCQWS